MPTECFDDRNNFVSEEMMIMFRKMMLALATVAAIGTVAIPSAEARGFGGGGFHGGFHGGGFHGGYRGGGWGRGIGVGVGLGLLGAGLYGAYAYDPAYYGYGSGCYPRRVWTPYGWRIREFCGY
jgi:hypothetical protein